MTVAVSVAALVLAGNAYAVGPNGETGNQQALRDGSGTGPQTAQARAGIDAESAGRPGMADGAGPAGAAQSGVHEAGTGLENPEMKETTQGTGQGLTAEEAALRPGSGDAEGRQGRVADAVRKMEQITEKSGELGTRIGTAAQEQVRNQEAIEERLEKAQGRSGFVRFLVGTDRDEIRAAEDLLTENRNRIESMRRFAEGLSTEDREALTQQILVLEQANEEIESSLEAEQDVPSLFGWVFDIFSD